MQSLDPAIQSLRLPRRPIHPAIPRSPMGMGLAWNAGEPKVTALYPHQAQSRGRRESAEERANNSLQLTRLACGKLECDLPARMRENEASGA
jgi:hypothetical protein